MFDAWPKIPGVVGVGLTCLITKRRTHLSCRNMNLVSHIPRDENLIISTAGRDDAALTGMHAMAIKMWMLLVNWTRRRGLPCPML